MSHVLYSWNLGNAKTHRKVEDLERFVREGAHVIATQETGGQDGAAVVVAFLHLHPTWAVALPDWSNAGHPERSVLTLYDTARFPAYAWTPRRVAIGDLEKAAGPSRIGHKSAGVVTLTDTDGAVLPLANIHVVASWTQARMPDRVAAARRHVNAVATGPADVVCGDFNGPQKRVAPWLGTGWTFAASGPTRGVRRIDMIAARRGVRVSRATTHATSSDHRAVRAVVTPTPPPIPAPVPTTEEPEMSNTPMTDALVKELRSRGVTVLTHSQWGSQRRSTYAARLRTRPHGLLPSRPVDTLWNHITVTGDSGKLVGNFKTDLRTVERIGFERFGTGTSYNILVDQNASKPTVAIGQFLEARGAHTINDKNIKGFSKDQNKVSLAVAWVGMPGDRLNAHAVTAMVEVRRALIKIGAMTRTYDDVPHSLVAAKDCPTNELRDRLPSLKRAALAALAAPAPSTDGRTGAAKTPRWDELVDIAKALLADAKRQKALPRIAALNTIVALGSRWSTKHDN